MITNHITYDRPALDIEYDYVGIIDGLEPKDRNDFRITERLRALLNSAGVATALAEVGSEAELLGALETFRKEASAGRRFMLHFVSHGNEDGIAAGAQFASWIKMRPFLKRIHAATKETLLLNMSTCKGLHGVKVVDETDAYPFFGLIGAKEDLGVGDALRANGIVYTKWLEGMTVPQIVAATNSEMGKELLYNISAEGYRKLSSKPTGGVQED
jgi:hypothetical protein